MTGKDKPGLPRVALLGAATALFALSAACRSTPDEPASRAASAHDEGNQRATEAMRGALPDVPAPSATSATSATGSTGSWLTPDAAPTETELAQLPLPPFPGSRVKRFLRQPTWARPGAYTLAVEGAGNAGDVASFYLKRIRQKDASAEAETVTPTYIRLRSTAASATIDVAVAKDGKTITTQIGYGMF